MKRLDFRCVNGRGFIAGEINFISRGAVCHVEFIFTEGLQIQLADGSWFVIPPNSAIGAHADGGVAIRGINHYDVDYRFSVQCTDEQYANAIAFLHGQIGKPYDFLDIVGIMVNRDWHNPERWICSELWAATMESAELMKAIPTAIQLFTPQDALIVSSAMYGLPTRA